MRLFDNIIKARCPDLAPKRLNLSHIYQPGAQRDKRFGFNATGKFKWDVFGFVVKPPATLKAQLCRVLDVSAPRRKVFVELIHRVTFKDVIISVFPEKARIKLFFCVSDAQKHGVPGVFCLFVRSRGCTGC